VSYFSDLSIYSYHERNAHADTYNVAWLDKSHDFPQGDVPSVFVENLWNYCLNPVVKHRGFHTCSFCDTKDDHPAMIRRGATTYLLGSAEIRVFGKGGRLYAAPD
jgi:hypothetical protein